MSSITEKLAAIRQLFMGELPPGVPPVANPQPAPEPPAPAAFKDYMTADGVTTLSIDKMEVGGKVNIAGAPAPDGEYALQDGHKIKVMAGAITEIEAAAPPAPAPAPAPVDLSTPQAMREQLQSFAISDNPDMKKLAMIVSALFEDRFGWELKRAEEEAKRTEAIEAYKQGFADHKEKTEKAISQLIEVFDEFAKVEKDEPPVLPQSFRKNDSEGKAKRIDALAEKLKEMKVKN